MTTETESKFLDELIKDSITYKLSEIEALEYIKVRFRPVSSSTFRHRKSEILSDNSINLWLSDYTRLGFVISHKQHIESIQAILDDSLRQFYHEKDKPLRNEDRIFRLKSNIIEDIKLLSELNLGTPIISAIKARIQEIKKENPSLDIKNIE